MAGGEKWNDGMYRAKAMAMKRETGAPKLRSDQDFYKGDLQCDTLEELLERTELPQRWATIAEKDLGFAPIDQKVFWDDANLSRRMDTYYRLFLLLVRNKVEDLADVEAMLAETDKHREALRKLNDGLKSKGVKFYGSPFDILTLLVLLWLGGSRAIISLGVYQFDDNIHRALNIVGDFMLPLVKDDED